MTVVRGSGHIPAKVMLVGWVPSAQERMAGSAGVGSSGAILHTMCERVGIPHAALYITYVWRGDNPISLRGEWERIGEPNIVIKWGVWHAATWLCVPFWESIKILGPVPSPTSTVYDPAIALQRWKRVKTDLDAYLS